MLGEGYTMKDKKKARTKDEGSKKDLRP